MQFEKDIVGSTSNLLLFTENALVKLLEKNVYRNEDIRKSSELSSYLTYFIPLQRNPSYFKVALKFYFKH